jgi:hypothetical protein
MPENPQIRLVAALDFAFLDDLFQGSIINSSPLHAFPGVTGNPHILAKPLAKKVSQYNLLSNHSWTDA